MKISFLTKVFQIQCSPQCPKNKRTFASDREFELVYGNAKGINEIIKSLNVNKAKGADELL